MPDDVSAHAVEKYAAAPRVKRRGIGLSLSGGGFRASLFHLGALTRLNELGVLASVNTISSVSGCSILSAFLATRLTFPLTGPVHNWNDLVVVPFREFTTKDIRTGPILSRLLPWNWFDSDNGVDHLQDTYHERLTKKKTLGDLPQNPTFIYCSTDMQFGVNWVFERARLGDYQVGYVTPHPATWPLAKAVAASSCFPPIFNPMKVMLKPANLVGGKAATRKEYANCIANLRLTDGGCYDNLGLEPIWKSHAVVLCSDGGGTFDFEADKHLIWRVQRYTSILDSQAGALRKRWLISNFIVNELSGTYWGTSTDVKSYDEANSVGYSKDLADDVISEIRTDLDAFSDAEASVLINHGYLLADAAVRRHTPHLVGQAAVATIPYPNWMDETIVRRALKDSHKRKTFGR